MDKIDLIRRWAKYKPWFDMSFIDDVEEWCLFNDMTYDQEEALDNIIEKFNIKDGVDRM